MPSIKKKKSQLKKTKEKLKIEKKKLKKEKEYKKKVAHSILKRARKMRTHPRDLSTYSRSYQYKLIKQIKETLEYLGFSNYNVYTVLVKNKGKQFRPIPVIDDRDQKPIDEDVLKRIEIAILLKDQFNISDAAYKALSSITDLPTFYAVSKIIQEANTILPITRTPGEEPGIQRNLEDILKLNINNLYDNCKLQSGENEIHVKISGDGTQVGHSNNFVNITCTVLNDIETANSPDGHQPIAIIAAPEKYDVLKSHLADIVNSVTTFNSYTYRGKHFKIIYYLSGDYKFLLTVMGLASANSNFPCIKCKMAKTNFFDVSLSGALRTTDEIMELARKTSGQKYCCLRDPIFPTIPIDRVCFDLLHLFLRISDKLQNLLIDALEREDKFISAQKKGTRTKKTSEESCGKSFLEQFEDVIHDIGIGQFKFRADDEKGKPKARDLRGPEKLKLFSNLSGIWEILDQCTKLQEIERTKIPIIWTEFFEIYKELKNTPGFKSSQLPENLACLQARINKWLQTYIEVYERKTITPYMHLLTKHATEIIQVHGSLDIFNCQGLERFNDVTTKDYFGSTNHGRGTSSLTQLMNKYNRKLYLHTKGVSSQKRTYLCSICKKSGHSKNTCLNKTN